MAGSSRLCFFFCGSPCGAVDYHMLQTLINCFAIWQYRTAENAHKARGALSIRARFCLVFIATLLPGVGQKNMVAGRLPPLAGLVWVSNQDMCGEEPIP
ncbi:hypothetical protein BDN67DRAFT_386843 [Paxillus ammoniavirescens]|nr:hypothetical protein BDN67DRAFT_386843 [Paxillus ammoniavirescens]